MFFILFYFYLGSKAHFSAILEAQFKAHLEAIFVMLRPKINLFLQLQVQPISARPNEQKQAKPTASTIASHTLRSLALPASSRPACAWLSPPRMNVCLADFASLSCTSPVHSSRNTLDHRSLASSSTPSEHAVTAPGITLHLHA